jgi:hypothetical protein
MVAGRLADKIFRVAGHTDDVEPRSLEYAHDSLPDERLVLPYHDPDRLFGHEIKGGADAGMGIAPDPISRPRDTPLGLTGIG